VLQQTLVQIAGNAELRPPAAAQDEHG